MKSISSMCFGCEPLGGNDWGDVNVNTIKNAIYKALDLGVNSFDTAGVYGLGLSETRLSKILGNHRRDVVIATKGGLSWNKNDSGRNIIVKNSSPSAIRNDVESSLRRLKLETLPIFFVHWPDNNTPIEDTFIELLKLKNEGKIQSIGCSNFSAQQLNIACSVSQVDYIQVPLNILDGALDRNISEICTKNKIKVIAYNVLLYGLLTGKFNYSSNFPKNDRRSRLLMFKGFNFINTIEKIDVLKLKAAEDNTSLTHYVINWALKQDNVSTVVTGIKNSKQVVDNFSISNN